MQPGQGTLIEYKRIWASRRLVYWLALPTFLVLLDLIFSLNQPAEWIPGAPLMLVCLYAWLVLYLGHTQVRVDATSFELKPGPLPAGLSPQSHPKAEVKSIYRLRRPGSFGRGDYSSSFLAAIELNDGTRHLLQGPFSSPDAADVELQKIAFVWGQMPIDNPRKGKPTDQDPATLKVIKFWAILFGGSFLWGTIVSIFIG